MNDHDFEASFRAWSLDEAADRASGDFRARILSIPSTPPQPRRWRRRPPTVRFQSMFNATKFVVAGAIVALFGGFLLSGALTPQTTTLPPGAETREDLLPGVALTTVEVEPGVLRVLDDGAGHDLTDGTAQPPGDLTIGPDGSIWVFSTERTDSIFKLGREGTYGAGPLEGENMFFDAAVARDGTVWALLGGAGVEDPRRLASFDGSTWTEQAVPDANAIAAIEATPDGAVWVTRRVRVGVGVGPSRDGVGPSVARIDDGEWTALPTLDDPALAGNFHGWPAYFDVAPDGTIWLSNGYFHAGGTKARTTGLLRFDGDRWEVVTPMSDRPVHGAGPLALGTDGTLWVYLATGTSPSDDYFLARYDGAGWAVYTSEDDGVPRLIETQGYEARLTVDGDGTLWISFAGFGGVAEALAEAGIDAGTGAETGACPGLLSFDGSVWTQYLKGRCISRVAEAPDGSMWATAEYVCTDDCSDFQDTSQRSLGGLYVIRPKEVAATE